MSFCPNCGSQSSGATFCTSCGKSMVSVTPLVSTPPLPGEQPGVDVRVGTEGPVFPGAVTKGKNKTLIISLSAGAAALALGALLVSSLAPTPLERAVEACNIESASGVAIDDDGRGLFIDMRGEEDFSGARYADIECVIDELDMSPTVRSQMANTSSLMGVQTGSWDGINASWTYHPDRGLDISFKLD